MQSHQLAVFCKLSNLGLKPLLRACLLACLFVGGPGFASTVAAQQSGSLTPQELVALLQQGGYVLYARHAATDHSQSDQDLSDLRRCALQRNLSEQGKRESMEMGAAFKRLDIKVDEVFSSPYCRCVDTAQIAFGRYKIVDEMRATFFTNEEETKQLIAFLRMQLSKMPRDGHNTVLVGHTANLQDLTEVWPKPEGVAHVFRPLGEAGFEHLGRITPTDWNSLAATN